MINIESLSLRDATLEDLPKIVEIYNSTVGGRVVTADTEPVSVESRVKWFADHLKDFRPIWVLEYNNVICGWVSFQSFYGRPAMPKIAELDGVERDLIIVGKRVCQE